MQKMEVAEDIVIVGAGIAGLTTSLGLHRFGYKTIVLESSSSLRSTGFALTIWTNAWRALDALGIGDSLRRKHLLLRGNVVTMITGQTTSVQSFTTTKLGEDHEIRRVRRAQLLEALAKDLPAGTIRLSSKVVHIEESGYFKLVHLSDGTIIKTKVLIGCDGVNSVVAKWLGFKTPIYSGRSSLRGNAVFESNHGFEPKSNQFFGDDIRAGFIPCDDRDVYWFITYTPTGEVKKIEKDPFKMKQYMMNKLGKQAESMISVMGKTEPNDIIFAPIRFRHPWDLLWGKISKNNVCVAGDALHPMTPDIGQGGCSALEDGVVLARCLAEALSKTSHADFSEENVKEECENINLGMKKYANERKWRSFVLISTAYVVGKVQQGNGKVIGFLRDKFLSNYLNDMMLKVSDFDCGKLSIS